MRAQLDYRDLPDVKPLVIKSAASHHGHGDGHGGFGGGGGGGFGSTRMTINLGAGGAGLGGLGDLVGGGLSQASVTSTSTSDDA